MTGCKIRGIKILIELKQRSLEMQTHHAFVASIILPLHKNLVQAKMRK